MARGETDAYAPASPDGKAEIAVTQPLLYAPERGWGFVTEKNRREQESLRLPELNSGFEPVWWYQDEDITRLEMKEEGCRNADALRQECGGTEDSRSCSRRM